VICLALGYGSKGSEVKKLQKTLNSQGAGLKVDGVWGPKTQAAVEKYGTKAAAKTAAAIILQGYLDFRSRSPD